MNRATRGVVRSPRRTFSALAWLAARRNFEAVQGADTAAAFAAGKLRLRELLRAVGDPHNALPAVIHVAGSKGKGSTCAFVASILRSAGLHVGVYSSPHVVEFGERLRVGNSAAISAADWSALVEEGRAAVAAEHLDPALTHFEIVTALALRHFVAERVDVAVVEAGMGGEHDATNVFGGGNLASAVVTHIGMDHAEHLGGTLEKIAVHKAGVCVRGAPLILAEQGPATAGAVSAAIGAVAAARSVAVERVEDCVRATSERVVGIRGDRSNVARFEWDDGILEAVSLRMGGAHQVRNAATAVHATLRLARRDSGGEARGGAWERIVRHAERCGRRPARVDAQIIARGLAQASLPGRFEVRAYAESGKHSSPVLVLDCAHNADAAVALRDALDDAYPAGEGWTRTLVVAMAADKDTAGFAETLAPGVVAARGGRVVVTSVPIAGSRSRSALPERLAALWTRAVGGDAGRVTVRASVEEALADAMGRKRGSAEKLAAEGGSKHVVCVTGSVYSVAAARAALDGTT